MGRKIKTISLEGKRFGRWVVQDKICCKNRQRLWECVCDCGTRRYVNENNLISGKTLSCGCISKENGKKRIRDLTGKRFGNLEVIDQAPNKNGRVAWNCICECGRRCVVTGHDLTQGHTASCGNRIHVVGKHICDLSGKVFGRLTALNPTEERDYKGSVMWNCRCICQSELLVSQDALVNGRKKSCGCLKRDIGKRLHSRLHFEGGTCIELLHRHKARSDSSTRVQGVNETKNHKFVSYIGFKGAKYYLGRYETLSEAASVRTEAQEAVHGTYIREYHDWVNKNGGDLEGFLFEVDYTEEGFVIRTNGGNKNG